MRFDDLEFAPRPITPAGLKGWLLLPLLGLFITIWLVGHSMYSDLLPLLEPGTWEALTTPGSPAYASFWAPYIALSLAANLVLLVGAATLIVLALLKKALFPRLMIGFYIFTLCAVSADLWALNTFVSAAFPEMTKIAGPDANKAVSRAVLACLIWVPYFLISKRVKNTFVR